MAASRTIVVAGAGIGGLTAAIALAQKNFRVIVIERAERPDEAGAGLQLSPNASRVLIELGLAQYLEKKALMSDGISIVSARAGREIATIPLGEATKSRYGAPYWIVHRADLQSALVACAQNHPDIDLRFGWQYEDVASHPRGITVVQRRDVTRQQETALALIGADGVWSSVRHQLQPKMQPQFTGSIAWRGMADAARLPRDLATRRVQLWMGPDAHLVAYPMADGARINVVAIVHGTWNRPGWSEPGNAAEIGARFASSEWRGAARMLVGGVDEWRKWALFALPDGGAWGEGPIALLGDAAHAMLPFAAQGAGMAIEDAAVIAKCLSENDTDAARAFAQYRAQRTSRVTRVQKLARRQGQIYRMRGLGALARDSAIGLLGKRLLSRQDWIYDWRP